MKSATPIFILAIALLSACSVLQKDKPGVSESAPIPDTAMAIRSITSLDTLQKRHGVYMRKWRNFWSGWKNNPYSAQ